MPRDPSGNYTLPGGGLNPVVTATPITITWWNTTGTDLASAMTDSLSRTGSGGMLGPLGAVDGTAMAPGLTFQSETTTGIYRPTAAEFDAVVGGTRLSRWTSAGFQESFDNGATWVTPVYENVAAQDMGATGALNFAVGKLTIASVAVHAQPTVTKATTSTGTFTSTNTSYAAVTNATVTITATGGPVHVQLVADDSGTPSTLNVVDTNSGATSILGQLALSTDGGSTFFAEQQFGYGWPLFSPTVTIQPYFPVSTYSAVFAPSPGSVTVALYIKVFTLAGTCTAAVTHAKLCVTQY